MSPAERDRLIREVDAVLDLANKRHQEAVETHREALQAISLLWRVTGNEETMPVEPVASPLTAPVVTSQPDPAESENSTSPSVKAHVLGALAAFDQGTFTSVDVLSLIENELTGADRNAKLNRVSTALRRLAEKGEVITQAAKGRPGETVQYRRIPQEVAAEA